MKRTWVKSSSLRSVGYDRDAGTLELEWKGGSVYQYFMVPGSVYDELMQAASLGAFVNDRIKPSFPCAQLK